MRKIIAGQAFEWDDEKERKNLSSHGLDFETATHVFEDSLRIERIDYKHSTADELRFFTIGMVGEMIAVVAVVYAERGDAIRIISARIATKEEQEEYLWHTKQ